MQLRKKEKKNLYIYIYIYVIMKISNGSIRGPRLALATPEVLQKKKKIRC